MQENIGKQEVLKAGIALVDLGLVTRTWGNISCRIDDKRFAVTPSGIGYDRLTEDSIVVVDIDTCKYEGEIKPSSEKGIHAIAYSLNPETNFVIHTHQTYASVASVTGFSSLAPTDEELSILGGKISKAEYGRPGTGKLKRHVEKALKQGSSAVLMENHGAVLIGCDRETAFKRAAVLEDVCRRTSIDVDMSDELLSASSRLDDDIPLDHKPFYKNYPQFNNIMTLKNRAVTEVMNNTDVLSPMLDDFAQMVGIDMKVCTNVSDAINAIKKRNAVFLKNIGAICCSGSESDCKALLTLINKNSLAYLNAEKNRNSKSLSRFDSKLMRLIYTKSYSKKNKSD